MTKLFLGAIAIGAISGCGMFAGNPSKFDKIQEQVECRLDLLEPYAGIITEENLHRALAGDLNPVDVLVALDVSTQDVLDFTYGWKVCNGSQEEKEEVK